jgi:hypothetical protein
VKIDVDHKDRAAIANLCRAKSMTADENSRETKSDRQRVEYQEEARYFEELAIRFDHGEQLVLEQKTPITPNPRIDLDQLDAPQKTTNIEAERISGRRTAHRGTSQLDVRGGESRGSASEGSTASEPLARTGHA